MVYIVIGCAVVLVWNLWELWPSIAGLILFGVVWPLFYQSTLQDRIVARGLATAAALEASARSIRPVLVGGAVALGIICLIEAYFSFCHARIGGLADRKGDAYCWGEVATLGLLMGARRLKEWFSFRPIVLASLGYLIILGLSSAAQFKVQRISTLFAGPIAQGALAIATGLITLSVFSFWPVVDGSSTELTRVVAQFRLGVELESQNARFYAATKRQEQVGRRTIKLLQGKGLSQSEQLQTDELREAIDAIYEAAADIEKKANDSLDPNRANEIIKDAHDRLFPARPKQAPPPPVCGVDRGAVCAQDIRRLGGADVYVENQEKLDKGREAASGRLKADVVFPLTEEIEGHLRNKYGSDHPDAVRLTAIIVMTLLDGMSAGTDASLTQLVQQRATLARSLDVGARVEIAYLVCQGLQETLIAFLRSSEGRNLLTKISRNRGGFVNANTHEVGRELPAAPDPIMRKVDDLVGQSQFERSEVRLAVMSGLGQSPPRFNEREWEVERASISGLVGNILKAACYEGLKREAFLERLTKLAA